MQGDKCCRCQDLFCVRSKNMFSENLAILRHNSEPFSDSFLLSIESGYRDPGIGCFIAAYNSAKASGSSAVSLILRPIQALLTGIFRTSFCIVRVSETAQFFIFRKILRKIFRMIPAHARPPTRNYSRSGKNCIKIAQDFRPEQSILPQRSVCHFPDWLTRFPVSQSDRYRAPDRKSLYLRLSLAMTIT